MDKRLLPILVASLLAASPAAVAQQGLKYTGSVGFGGIYSNVTSRNPAEFYEYRDMESGFLSEIDVRGRGDRYYLDFFAENLNRTDQFIELKGGRYNQFKYQVYGDWLQHNLSTGLDPLEVFPFQVQVVSTSLPGKFLSREMPSRRGESVSLGLFLNDHG